MRFALLIALYVALNSAAQLFLKQGASAVAGSATLFGLPLNTKLIVGIGLFGLSFLVWIFILAKENLSYAFPFAAGLGYSAVVLLAVMYLGESVSHWQLAGIGLVLLGLVLIAGG